MILKAMNDESNVPTFPWCGSLETSSKSSLVTAAIVDKYRRDFNVLVGHFFSEEEVFLLICNSCDLQFFQNVKPGDRDFYEAISKNLKYYSEQKPEFDFIREHIHKMKPRSVLDFGSGGGGFLLSLKDVRDKRGLEFTETSKDLLKKKGILLHESNINYEFITCFQVLEHLKDYSELKTCVTQNLKAGGCVFVSTPNPDSPDFAEIFQILDCPPHHLTRWSLSALRSFGRCLDLEELAYFQEPYSRAMLFPVLKERRRLVTGDGLRGRILERVGEIFDRIYLPYFEFPKLPGPTHGILFKKNEVAF